MHEVRKTELVQAKLIQSGDVLEIYHYSNGYLKGYESKPGSSGGRLKDEKSENYEIHREQVLNRARTNLRRTVNSNVNQYGREFTAKFLTLTFREHIQDLTTANYEFKKFMKRLNYYMYGTKKANIKYSAVPEFTQAGRVHYHIVFYNLPYVKANDVASVWGNGHIKINKIDDIDNVGAYICKYITKESSDPRLEGNKCYFGSRGLLKPLEITDKKKVDALSEALPVNNLVYSSSFENEYLGDISYKQYNLKIQNKSTT